MSVSKRGNVYRARVYLPGGKQRSKTCRLKSQAKQWEADQMAAIATGSLPTPRLSFASSWYPESTHTSGKAASGSQQRHCAISRYISPSAGQSSRA